MTRQPVIEVERMKDELFIQNFAEQQHRIYAFILSLSPNWNEAEDIFQRTSIVLWKKWSDYDSSRSFISWSLGVARLEFLQFMAEKSRSREVLSGDAIDAIESRFVETDEAVSLRMDALKHCLEKLPGKKRELVDQCYGSKARIMDVAAKMGVTSDALYWRIKRIREALHACVDKKLALED